VLSLCLSWFVWKQVAFLAGQVAKFASILAVTVGRGGDFSLWRSLARTSPGVKRPWDLIQSAHYGGASRWEVAKSGVLEIAINAYIIINRNI